MKTTIRSFPATPIFSATTEAAICARDLPPLPDTGTTLKWRLSDAHNQYGILLATLPAGRHLSHDQQQLVDTLVEQLTGTALDRHQERQQQLIVMEERATIARELHDSIAQSLSCMKMQVSCLQMQGDDLPGEPPAAGANP
jgi:two-component system nitrate/nitrite sensor histidine kinase NarX